MAGAYETGEYRNLFAEIGYRPEEIQNRLEEIFRTMFYGKEDERIYHPVEDDMGYLTDTGKIIRKPCHNAVVRERRKLKKQKKLLDAGIMDFADIRCSYSSWRGSMKYRNARKTVHSMDKLYDSLFIESWMKGGVQHG